MSRIIKGKKEFLLVLTLFSLLLISCFVSAADTSAQFTRSAGGYYNDETTDLFTADKCSGANDVVVQILPGACSPVLVRSDLLEENDVPVFCQLTAIRYNPTIDIQNIVSVSPTLLSKSSDTVLGVRYYPARAFIQSYGNQLANSPYVSSSTLNPFANTIGYVVLVLKKQPNENKMPDSVSAEISLKLNYKSGNAFGFAKTNFYLKEMTDSEWRLKYKQYAFWRGLGYARAESIGKDAQGEYINVGLYKDAENKFADIKLRTSQTSQNIWVPSPNLNSCPPEAVIKLQKIDYPQTKALLKINNEETWVRTGDLILDAKCSIKTIDEENNKIKISCNGNKDFELLLSPPTATLTYKYNDLSKEGKYKVGDEIENGVYVAYIGNTDNANPTLKENSPNKEFIVLVNIANSNAAITLDDAFFKTFGYFVERELQQRELRGTKLQLAQDFLKNTLRMVSGQASLISLSKDRVDYLGKLESVLQDDFDNKFTFRVIELGNKGTLSTLTDIIYEEKNSIDDKEYTDSLGKLLEYYYKNAIESYQDTYKNYGTIDYSEDFLKGVNENYEDVGILLPTSSGTIKFGELALIKAAVLSNKLLKNLVAQGFYTEVISAFGSTNPEIRAFAEEGLVHLNRDLSKSSNTIKIINEEYEFVLESIIPVSLDDKNAELTISSVDISPSREKYAEDEVLDKEGKVTLTTISDEYVTINYVQDVTTNTIKSTCRFDLDQENSYSNCGDIRIKVTRILDDTQVTLTATTISAFALKANPNLVPLGGTYKTGIKIPYSTDSGSKVSDLTIKEIHSADGWILIENQATQTSTSTSGRSENFKVGDMKTFYLDNSKSLTVTLNAINIKKEASLSLEAQKDYGKTTTNVTVRVGIEKRAIQLSPEKTKELIKTLDKTIDQWSGIRDKLKDAIKVMKSACFVTQTGLWIKYFVINTWTNKGSSIARKKVMETWKVKCSSEVGGTGTGKEFTTYHACFMKYSPNIDKDVANMQQSINSINNQIKDCKKNTGVVTQVPSSFNLFTLSLAGNEVLDSEKFIQQCLGQNNFGEDLNQAQYDALITDRYFAINSVQKVYEMNQIKADCLLKKFTQEFCDANEEAYKAYIDSAAEQADNLIEKKALQAAITAKAGEARIPTAVLDKDSIQVKTNIYKPTPEEIRNINAQNLVYPISDKDHLAYLSVNNIGYILKLINYDEYNYKIDKIYAEADYSEIIKDDTPNSIYTKIMKYQIIENTQGVYKYEYENQEVIYWESGPNKGLPAIVPLGKYAKDGWYVATESSTVGVAYTDAGQLVSFWLGNVYKNKRMDFDSPSKGDDVLQQFDFRTGQPLNSYAGLSKEEAAKLISEAQRIINEASRQYGKAKNNKITIDGIPFTIGKPATGTAGNVQCEDLMSPKDCHLLFNLCDPVMCPSSRCNFGGRYPVANVQETGILGSIMLCWPNQKEGIVVPICLSGVYAGVDNLVVILNATRECLNTSLETGETVGICDQIRSFYLCDLFWRQALPFLKTALPSILGKVSGTSTGGGEYFTGKEAFDNLEQSIQFFTNEYGTSSFAAFRARTTEEFGGDLCKMFFSARVPGGQGFFESLIEPESPTQFYVKFEEIPLTTVTVPPKSQYKVYYRIYAGRDQGVSYSVYLRSPSAQQYYQQSPTLQIPGATGYIAKGSYKDISTDFQASAGYKEICVVINGREECGFKQVTTGFTLNELQDLYVKEQALQEITTEKACIEGTPSLQPFKLLNPNLQATLQESISPEIYKYGIIRICATEQPDFKIDPTRWEKVGNCGNERIGCWLDKNSINNGTIKDLLIQNQTMQGVSDISKMLNDITSTSFSTEAESKDQLSKAIDSLAIAKTKIDALVQGYLDGTIKTTTEKTSDIKIDVKSNKYPSLFKFDSVELKDAAERVNLKKEIENALSQIDQSDVQSVEIEINGYASKEIDSDQQNEHNKVLAKKRADAIKSHMETLEAYTKISSKVLKSTAIGNAASNFFAIEKNSAIVVQAELDRINKLSDSAKQTAFASSAILAEDRRVIITFKLNSKTVTEKTTEKITIEPKDVTADILRSQITTILTEYKLPQQFDYIIENSLDDTYAAYAQLYKAELYDIISTNVYKIVEKIEAEYIAKLEKEKEKEQPSEEKKTVVSLDYFKTGVFYNYAFPVKNPDAVTKFGISNDGCHHDYSALDLYGPKKEPLVAITDGTIYLVGIAPDGKCGYAFIMLGDDGWYYTYCHLSSVTRGLKIGERIKVGEIVGYIGNTGNAVSKQPHLHFDMEFHGTPQQKAKLSTQLIEQLKKAPSQKYPGIKGTCVGNDYLGPSDFLNTIKKGMGYTSEAGVVSSASGQTTPPIPITNDLSSLLGTAEMLYNSQQKGIKPSSRYTANSASFVSSLLADNNDKLKSKFEITNNDAALIAQLKKNKFEVHSFNVNYPPATTLYLMEDAKPGDIVAFDNPISFSRLFVKDKPVFGIFKGYNSNSAKAEIYTISLNFVTGYGKIVLKEYYSRQIKEIYPSR